LYITVNNAETLVQYQECNIRARSYKSKNISYSYPINSYQRKYTVIQLFNYLSKLSPKWGMQPIVQPTQ